MKKKKFSEFVGKAQIYKDTVFINTNTGQGYGEVIKKFAALIEFFSNKYKLKNFTKNDMRQNIIVYILEALPKYNPKKNVKLSTFIQMKIERALINRLTNENKQSRDATYLNVKFGKIVCSCGLSNEGNLSDLQNTNCSECGKPLGSFKACRVAASPVSLDSLFSDSTDINEESANDKLSRSNVNMPFVYNEDIPLDEQVIKKQDLLNWLNKQDKITKKILENIVYKDKSLFQSAKDAGVSHTWAHNKIIHKSKSKITKDFLGK